MLLRNARTLIVLATLVPLVACNGDSGESGDEAANTETAGTADTTGPDTGESASSSADDDVDSSSSDTVDGPDSDTMDSSSDTVDGPDSDTLDGPDSDTVDSSSSDTATDTVDGTATDTVDGDTATDTDTGGPFCGDGVIDPGEDCDDGPDIGPEFDCLSDCTFNICGDGFPGPQEGCDDGNMIDGDGCTAMCQIEFAPPEAVFCGNKLYECGDTIDNDNDGLIDLDDPECISPCDDNEDSFQTDLPGQNNDCKQDCYFDDNSGSGDDTCEWNLICDPLNPGVNIGCEYDPNFDMCDLDMPQTCLDFCVPLVPNGCDCFGCCLIDGDYWYLDASEDCSLDNLEGCEPCTFFEGCNNECEMCELCFGQDPEDLPPECDEPECPDGIQSCFDETDCALGQFCQTGCCQDIQ
jgi:cysteine-rich repeat protein